MFVAFVAAAAAASTPVVEPTAEESSAALKAIVLCYKMQASQLDDGKSGADVIASAVVGACSRELDAMDEISKRKIIAIVNSTPGMRQSDRNRLALTLLQTKPQEMRKDLEGRAVEVVLRARTKGNNAQD